MAKKERNALNTIFIFGIGGLALNALKQYFEIRNEEKEKFDWKEFGNWGLGGAVVGGGVILGQLIFDEVQLAIAEDPTGRESTYLRRVLKNRSKRSDDLYAVKKLKKEELNEAISQEFWGIIYRPLEHGSGGKSTAISKNSDVDVLLPFRKKSFSTLEEMYESLHAFLQEYASEDGDIYRIRRQGKSLGVFYSHRGEKFTIDVVPGREINSFPEDGDLSLFVKGSFWNSPTSMKTNLKKQKEDLLNRPTLRGTIRLLKIWAKEHSVGVPSIALERLTVNAFNKYKFHLPDTLFDKLMMTLTYIRHTSGSKNLIDPGNSNNILLNKSDGKNLASTTELMLENIKSDRRYLSLYFPDN